MKKMNLEPCSISGRHDGLGGVDDAGLPADVGGAVADLQQPAAEDREAGEEEARGALKMTSMCGTRRSGSCGSLETFKLGGSSTNVYKPSFPTRSVGCV